MPAARAARLTGQPSAMRSTRTSLPRGVRQALACGTRAPPATVVSTPTAEGYGPSTRQQPDWELELGRIQKMSSPLGKRYEIGLSSCSRHEAASSATVTS